jgi:hypothetical protein
VEISFNLSIGESGTDGLVLMYLVSTIRGALVPKKIAVNYLYVYFFIHILVEKSSILSK